MQITSLGAGNVRNLTDLHMECGPGINIIYGQNAAGKTAILESIHLLARAGSFRTPRITEVIQHGKPQLTVTAHLEDEAKQQIYTGLEKGWRKTNIKFNGNKVARLSEQAQNIPIITLSAEGQQLLTGTPRERRHWLDWSLFHVEPAYMQHWQDYHHALRQRNALLMRQARGAEMVPWEEQMAAAGIKLAAARKSYLKQILSELREVAEGEFGEIGIEAGQGGTSPEAIRQDLEQQRKADLLAGHTRKGPHRESIQFILDGRDAGRTLSRGEGKRLIVFLYIAQAVIYQARKAQRAIMLMDDLAAELDEAARLKILAALERRDQQTFITTTQPEYFHSENMGWRRFHVERGRIAKVIE